MRFSIRAPEAVSGRRQVRIRVLSGALLGLGIRGSGRMGMGGQDQMRDLGRKREEHDRVLGIGLGRVRRI